MDPREAPAYDIAEAAHYLRLPKSTLGNWVRGHKTFKPVLKTPTDRHTLSFINLVEAHMLWAITRHHHIPLQKVRRALRYLTQQFRDPHPLANVPLETDKINLLVQVMGKTINASEEGQVVMREVVEASLRRIERGVKDDPIVLYPFVTSDVANERKTVMFNPSVAFGRLVLVGTGIPTTEVAQRYKAGESITELADDYERSAIEIEDAIRFELPEAA